MLAWSQVEIYDQDPRIPQFCPRITCSEDLGTRLCYQHSGDSPARHIKVSPCKNPNEVCDIFPNRRIAWVDTDRQHWSFKGNERSQDPKYSNVYMANTLGYCRAAPSILQTNLHAGRRC